MMAKSYCENCSFMAFNEKVKLLFIEHMRRVACGKSANCRMHIEQITQTLLARDDEGPSPI